MISDSRRIHHPFGSDHAGCIRIFVTVVDHFFDPRLNDRFCALVARKKRNIQFRSRKTSSIIIQNGIQLTVRRIYILCLQRVIPFSCPREFIVRASDRESIIPHGQDLIILAHDTAPDLCIRIFGAHAGKHGNSHEIFVPGKVTFSFVVQI